MPLVVTIISYTGPCSQANPICVELNSERNGYEMEKTAKKVMDQMAEMNNKTDEVLERVMRHLMPAQKWGSIA